MRLRETEQLAKALWLLSGRTGIQTQVVWLYDMKSCRRSLFCMVSVHMLVVQTACPVDNVIIQLPAIYEVSCLVPGIACCVCVISNPPDYPRFTLPHLMGEETGLRGVKSLIGDYPHDGFRI